MSNIPTPHHPTPATALSARTRGWTPDRQRKFIEALADCGSVTEAAERAGMSKQSAYNLRRHPDAAEFRKGWDEALIDAWRRVEETALERVTNGETEIYMKDGVQVVRHRPCSQQLMIHMLDRAERRIAAARAAVNAEAAEQSRRTIEYIRQKIRAEAGNAPASAAETAKLAAMPCPPKPEDGETMAMRRFHLLKMAFPDHSTLDGSAPVPPAKPARTRKLRQLGALTSAPHASANGPLQSSG